MKEKITNNHYDYYNTRHSLQVMNLLLNIIIIY